ncbi:hypothetical protein [Hymenobacter sp.]|jgi:hypothetical protein|uniref:hypothetical protein n=1 Tax=Hymenobacter sp. TaxID=1898978 RepID=UPI002EDA32AA
MKNLFTFLVLLAVAGTSHVVEAGSGDQNNPNARATQMARQLAQKAQLSEGQYVKVRQLNLRLLNNMQDAKTRLASDPAALDQQIAELQAHYEWDLTAIIGPRQMLAYNQNKASFMAMSSR